MSYINECLEISSTMVFDLYHFKNGEQINHIKNQSSHFIHGYLKDKMTDQLAEDIMLRSSGEILTVHLIDPDNICESEVVYLIVTGYTTG